MAKEKKDNVTEIENKKSKTSHRYSDGEKIDAIVWLYAAQHQVGEEIKPDFALVSKRLLIADNTLRNWWDQREDVLRKASRDVATLSEIMQVELSAQIKNIFKELNRRGYQRFTNSDLTRALKEFTLQFRLVTGQPTQILDHRGSEPYQPILPDYKPGLIDLGEAKVIEDKSGDNAT